MNATVTLRTAGPSDVPAIHRLITDNVENGHLLPRSVEDVGRHVARFVVASVDGAVVVRPCGVDVDEQPLEERALAGCVLDQPLDEANPRAVVGVHRRPGALQHEAEHELWVVERQLLGNDAAAREAGDVGGGDPERP